MHAEGVRPEAAPVADPGRRGDRVVVVPRHGRQGEGLQSAAVRGVERVVEQRHRAIRRLRVRDRGDPGPAAGEVPHRDRRVLGARGQGAAVGTELQPAHRGSGCRRQFAHAAVAHVDQVHAAGAGADRQLRPVAAEAPAAHRIGQRQLQSPAHGHGAQFVQGQLAGAAGAEPHAAVRRAAATSRSAARLRSGDAARSPSSRRWRGTGRCPGSGARDRCASAPARSARRRWPPGRRGRGPAAGGRSSSPLATSSGIDVGDPRIGKRRLVRHGRDQARAVGRIAQPAVHHPGPRQRGGPRFGGGRPALAAAGDLVHAHRALPARAVQRDREFVAARRQRQRVDRLALVGRDQVDEPWRVGEQRADALAFHRGVRAAAGGLHFREVGDQRPQRGKAVALGQRRLRGLRAQVPRAVAGLDGMGIGAAPLHRGGDQAAGQREHEGAQRQRHPRLAPRPAQQPLRGIERPHADRAAIEVAAEVVGQGPRAGVALLRILGQALERRPPRGPARPGGAGCAAAPAPASPRA